MLLQQLSDMHNPPLSILYNIHPIEYYDDPLEHDIRVYHDVEDLLRDADRFDGTRFFWSTPTLPKPFRLDNYTEPKPRYSEGVGLVRSIEQVFQGHLTLEDANTTIEDVFAIGTDPDRTAGYLCEGYHQYITPKLVLALQALLQQGWPLWRIVLEAESDNNGNPTLIIYPTGFVEQLSGCLGVHYKSCEANATDCGGSGFKKWFAHWHQKIQAEHETG